MLKIAKRSACDRCRAKRVRCPRAEDSTEPCARCVRIAAPCVTGSPGYIGRPRKGRSSSSSYRRSQQNNYHLEPHAHSEDGLLPVNTPMTPLRADASQNLLDLNAVETSRNVAYPPDGVVFQDQMNPWSAHGDSNPFELSLTEESSASQKISTLQQLSHLQEMQGESDSLDIMHAGQVLNNSLHVDFLQFSECQSTPDSTQCFKATSALMRFGEKMDQHISALGALCPDYIPMVEECVKSMDMGAENSVAVAIRCTKEFVDIIQNLTPTSSSSSFDELIQQSVTPPVDAVNSETTLLILSCYLKLMKLHNSLFHYVYQCLCQVPPETFKSMKVKAVFRIGGVPSMQDIPGNTYARGVIEVIQNQIESLEHCMGLPAAYCLSIESKPSPKRAGIFANADRARLLHTVMTQEDVRSPRGNNLYVESIRENLQKSIGILGV